MDWLARRNLDQSHRKPWPHAVNAAATDIYLRTYKYLLVLATRERIPRASDDDVGVDQLTSYRHVP